MSTLNDGAVWLMMCSPVAIEPVSDTSALWDVRSADRPPFCLCQTAVNHASREDIFRQLCQLQRGRGVISDGLSTTQFPAASAGAVSTQPSSADNSTVR